ncbi:amidohydrolase family protein [Halalkalibacter krulwichiae]|uniref:N-isopropylammelide isopropyl amidohydrolase n=1 Tax=Halalkalibacter krulwichiae TaxID=199441 RepID=A0A1X9MLE3_9BACI|nr:amidohydrolase family protein [Halalkalibacter krulwichiae]ARK32661.1 N-isopropylammelide isopropyl amidohydrolase [Halalkalibacter krulwichiae]
MSSIWRRVRVGRQLYKLTAEQGLFTKIEEDEDNKVTFENEIDAEGLLYIPALSDMHCHLDKHFIGETWRSRKAIDSLPKQLEREKKLLASLEGSVMDRARKLLQLMLEKGTTHIRTHVDVDPELGLTHLEAIKQVRDEFQGKVKIEIVAFPQQGLLRSKSYEVLKEAMEEGADLVGAVDPGGLDRHIESSLEHVFELATTYKSGVDIHLHDPGHLGLYTIDKVVDYTKEARLQGHVSVSHAYCLGQVSEEAVAKLGRRLKKHRISILSSVPIDRPMPNVTQLAALGVNVKLGTDNILDAWSPFGNVDMLARLSRLAERSNWVEDDQLVRAFRFATNDSLVPMLGERADFLLVSALNLEHAVATVPTREWVVVGGKAVAGSRYETGMSTSGKK